MVIEFYREHVAAGEPLQPLLHIVEFIAESPLANQLFAGTSKFDLLLFNAKDYLNADGVLQIAYRPQIHEFNFHYADFSGQAETKTCSEAEAFQTLRLYLGLKFGVLFKLPFN